MNVWGRRTQQKEQGNVKAKREKADTQECSVDRRQCKCSLGTIENRNRANKTPIPNFHGSVRLVLKQLLRDMIPSSLVLKSRRNDTTDILRTVSEIFKTYNS